jgi:hypothetical protein
MGSSLRRELPYGFGAFGDERLKKGGLCCIAPWLANRDRAFAGWVAASVLGRCGSRGFCGILR